MGDEEKVTKRKLMLDRRLCKDIFGESKTK